MIGIDGTEFSQKKIWDTGFAVRVSRDSEHQGNLVLFLKCSFRLK